MSDDTSRKPVLIVRGGESVLTDIELIEWIDHFGRGNVQELIAKRKDVWDVITYLRAERSLELAKGVAFVTDDLASFKKRTSSALTAEGSELCMEQRQLSIGE